MVVQRFLVSDRFGVTTAGEFGCENFGPDNLDQPALLVPSFDTLPAIVANDNQIAYIPASGVLAITQGGTWLIKSADGSVTI